jgi:Phytanoyl-CoA dioxygenase (PhyH)
VSTTDVRSLEVPVDLKERFDQDGFVVVPGVLSPEQVAGLREVCREKVLGDDLGYDGSPRGINDIFNRHPELRWVLFHEPTLSILRQILGADFVVTHECAVHLQNFGGWHKDTTSQERDGQVFQWERDYRMVEVGYYLQDNTDDYAGGLDIDPGSHVEPDHWVHPHLFVPNGVDAEPVGPRWQSIVNRAGDLVIFHFRANHRATQPDTPPLSIPEQHQKFAIFWAASSNTRHVEQYARYSASRPDYPWTQGYEWAPEVEDLARQHALALAPAAFLR